ncbi:MAG: DUF4058 family protein [Chloroflexi bacterium]|nr:MAG: DUF4058 family protein [Chloroflexota bacterium]
MPTPFPGMAPYLEQPGIWGEVHTRPLVAYTLVVDYKRPPTPPLSESADRWAESLLHSAGLR